MTNGWPTVPLGEVLRERRETPPPGGIEAGEIPIVSKIAFDTGRIELRTDSATKTTMILIQPGDLVVSGINAWQGAIAVYSGEGPIAATIHYGAYVPSPARVDIRFLWWLLRSGAFRELLFAFVPGGIKTELKAKRLLPIPIPLPPLPQQRRIVAKIDQLAAKIEEARGLKAECVQTPQALLPASLGEFFRQLAKKHPVPLLKEVSTTITDGPHKTPHYVDEGIPFVTVKNMVTGRLNFTDLKFITPADHREFSRRCKPERGDVLYSKDGATRGCPCFVDTDREFSIFVSVALIKPKRDMLDGRYLCHQLNSTWIKDHMADRSRGDMIPHIVLGEIANFPVPLPALHEQRRIVAYLDDLKEKVDRLKALQAQTAAELDALLPSILDKAFKGDL